jgi:putative membrane protein
MHWGYNFNMGYGFGWVIMILFWILIILGIIYLIKLLAGSSSADKKVKKSSAEEILRQRFARGEISREELEESMAVLRKHEG